MNKPDSKPHHLALDNNSLNPENTSSGNRKEGKERKPERQALTTLTPNGALKRKSPLFEQYSVLDGLDIVPHIQSQRDAFTMEEVGGEIVARFIKPGTKKRIFISPQTIVEQLENENTPAEIKRLTDIMLHETCKTLFQLIKEGIIKPYQKISINISGREVDSELAGRINRIVQGEYIDPHYLELEFTESYQVSSIDEMKLQMGALRAFGFSLALDDMGERHNNAEKIIELRKYIDTIKFGKSYIDKVLYEYQKNKGWNKSISELTELVGKPQELESDPTPLEFLIFCIKEAIQYGYDIVLEGIQNDKHLSHLRRIYRECHEDVQTRMQRSPFTLIDDIIPDNAAKTIENEKIRESIIKIYGERAHDDIRRHLIMRQISRLNNLYSYVKLGKEDSTRLIIQSYNYPREPVPFTQWSEFSGLPDFRQLGL